MAEEKPDAKRKTNPIDMEVGARIRLRRRLLGMTQAKLAAIVGVTFQQIQKYENGSNRVGASRIAQIAGILAVPPGFFFQNENQANLAKEKPIEQHPYADLLDFLGSSEGVELNTVFAKVENSTIRACVVALVKAIADADLECVGHHASCAAERPAGQRLRCYPKS